jgi:glycerol-3-phosphate O-acyltransferase
VEGPIEKLRRLAKIGTLVLVPTHSSNLDSVALGYVLMREGLPPVVYGAGKNLFSNPLIASSCTTSGPTGSIAGSGAALQGGAQDLLVHDDRARLSLAVLPGRHALALGAGRAPAQARAGWDGVEAFARNQARGVSGGRCTSCRRRSTTRWCSRRRR